MLNFNTTGNGPQFSLTRKSEFETKAHNQIQPAFVTTRHHLMVFEKESFDSQRSKILKEKDHLNANEIAED